MEWVNQYTAIEKETNIQSAEEKPHQKTSLKKVRQDNTRKGESQPKQKTKTTPSLRNIKITQLKGNTKPDKPLESKGAGACSVAEEDSARIPYSTCIGITHSGGA